MLVTLIAAAIGVSIAAVYVFAHVAPFVAHPHGGVMVDPQSRIFRFMHFFLAPRLARAIERLHSAEERIVRNSADNDAHVERDVAKIQITRLHARIPCTRARAAAQFLLAVWIGYPFVVVMQAIALVFANGCAVLFGRYFSPSMEVLRRAEEEGRSERYFMLAGPHRMPLPRVRGYPLYPGYAVLPLMAVFPEAFFGAVFNVLKFAGGFVMYVVSGIVALGILSYGIYGLVFGIRYAAQRLYAGFLRQRAI